MKSPLNTDSLEHEMQFWSIQDCELFTVYVNETLKFFPLISSDLVDLPSQSTIKEIGSGIGLLSLLVAQRGYNVVAFEPESAGFSLMRQFHSTVRSAWRHGPVSVSWFDSEYPAAGDQERADFVYAVNVIEHVPQWRDLVSNILIREKPHMKLRLIFPNYVYPYEPHFQSPTLFSKRLTKSIMSRKFRNTWIRDPEQFWEDLSWPTGTQIMKHCENMGYSCAFSNEAFLSYLERSQNDESFRQRKGKIFNGLVRVVFPILTSFSNWIPKRFLPVIDVTITKKL
jgi:SAM-dependent methyltransferase